MKLKVPQVIVNLNVKSKIALMLLFPLMGLLYFSVTGIWEKSGVVQEMGQLQELSALAVSSSELVHETQKERGRTAAFLGNSDAPSSDFVAQTSATDGKISELRSFLDGFDAEAFDDRFQGLLRSSLTQLDQIGGKRDAILARNISAADAIGYYTGMNSSFLDIVSYMASISSSAELTTQINVYVSLLQAKERVGIERAVLSNTFTGDKFGPGNFVKFVSLMAEQVAYTDTFLSLASDDQKSLFQSTISGDAVNEVERMRQVALDNSDRGRFDTDSGYWSIRSRRKLTSSKKWKTAWLWNLAKKLPGSPRRRVARGRPISSLRSLRWD